MEERLRVVAAVRTWLGTPYHHGASVRGAGVDCAMLLVEAFVEAGLIDRPDVPRYTHDWHLHRGEEKYLTVVERYTRELGQGEDPLIYRDAFSASPGDILVWRVGRTFSHGALVTEWPWVVHASYPARMVEEIELPGSPMAVRHMRHFSYWKD